MIINFAWFLHAVVWAFLVVWDVILIVCLWVATMLVLPVCTWVQCLQIAEIMLNWIIFCCKVKKSILFSLIYHRWQFYVVMDVNYMLVSNSQSKYFTDFHTWIQQNAWLYNSLHQQKNTKGESYIINVIQ